ncbi:DUF4232 domain-containing protein [Streptomyces sp. MMS24-I2-30]|uniref:DUF4232 domain-containing protein n=1 Tax=Streptomyces sp. MMS24-I2-30 TaxID=3351564 RepID=UPI003896AE15
MRVQKLSLLAIAVAAGLSVTACQGDDSGSSGTSDSPSAGDSASQNSGTQGSAGASTGHEAVNGGQVAGGGSGACQTSQLGFSTSGGMAEGTLIVNLKNTGSAACTLHGFPGADLKGKDGTVSADRSKLSAPQVSVQPGEETRFTLHYPPNDSGGTGATFTSLVVTPPDETHSFTLPVSINVPVTDGSGSGITVDPVGTGK